MINIHTREHYEIHHENGKYRVYRSKPLDKGTEQICRFRLISTCFKYDYQSQAIEKARELAHKNNINYVLPTD